MRYSCLGNLEPKKNPFTTYRNPFKLGIPNKLSILASFCRAFSKDLNSSGNINLKATTAERQNINQQNARIPFSEALKPTILSDARNFISKPSQSTSFHEALKPRVETQTFTNNIVNGTFTNRSSSQAINPANSRTFHPCNY